MQEKLFVPLDIKTGGFGPPGTGRETDEPWGHGYRKAYYFVPLPSPSDTPFASGSPGADFPPAGAPAGLAHMSVGDWTKFAVWQLRGDPANPHNEATLLSAENFARLHEPLPNSGYAGGWFTGTRNWAKGPRPGDTGCVLYHGGDNGRWSCVVWLAPEID